MQCLTGVMFALATFTAKAQMSTLENKALEEDVEESPFVSVNKSKMFQPTLVIEGWGLYSENNNSAEVPNANRTDIMFRRFRLGAKGTPYSWLSYSFQLHVDRYGEDVYTVVKGSYQGLGVWNAYITAKLLKESSLLNMHVGYYWAGISREFITSPYAVGSLDKTRANWFLRHFISGKGNGIESGIGLGGLKNWQSVGVSYRLGVYEPSAYASAKYADKLYTGRLMLSVGDAEQQKYKYMVSGNSWRRRSGVTFGVGASSQKNGALSDTSYFNHSYAYGADVLIEWKGLRIEGEYFMFTREAEAFEGFNGTQFHVRMGYGVVVLNKYIEPCISYDKYEGAGNKELYRFIGVDNTLDLGVNWYLNKDKLKLAVHYIRQGGTISNAGDYYAMALQLKI